MTKVFGQNWKTTLSGWITTLAFAIVAKPDVVDFLPVGSHKTITGIAGIIAIIAGGTFAYQVKDRNVTGGTVPQTFEAERRVDSPKI